jgi:hypothetical protein
MKNRERGTHRSLADGGGTAATSKQRKVQSPSNVAEERYGGVGVVDRDVGRVGVGGEQIDGGGSSVLRSGGEAQEAEEQRRKTMVWGKKISLPPPPYLYAYQVRVVGMVVLHSPDRFCSKSPRGGTEWGGSSCNRATRS